MKYKFDKLSEEFRPVILNFLNGTLCDIHCIDCPFHVAAGSPCELHRKVGSDKEFLQDYLRQLDNAKIDALFEKYGVPISEIYREKVTSSLKNKCCCNVRERGSGCNRCPFTMFTANVNNCIDITGGSLEFKDDDQITKVFTRYIELLNKEVEMKEQVLDLKSIEKNDKLWIQIYQLANKNSDGVCAKANVELTDELYLKVIGITGDYIKITHRGNVHRNNRLHNKERTHNQRKIQQLLEPYWIDKVEPRKVKYNFTAEGESHDNDEFKWSYGIWFESNKKVESKEISDLSTMIMDKLNENKEV